MLFSAPVPFREALESREVRTVLPTELRTRLLDEIALVASDAREDSSGAPGFISELSAARERIAALETSAAKAIAALKQTSP